MKRLTVWILGCLLVLGISGCVSKGTYLDLESDLADTRRQAEARDRELAALQQKFDALESANQELLNRLTQQETENAQRAAVNDELKAMLAAKRAELDEKEEVIDELVDTRRRIEAGLKDQIASQQIKIEDMEGRLKVTFVDKILFDSGSAEINPRGKELLLHFAESFSTTSDQYVTVEGHTDNVAVGPKLQERFPTNWELSTARATAVVRFLQDTAGLPAERLSAAGYGPYHPVASNESEAGRSQNRRIEIILVPVKS